MQASLARDIEKARTALNTLGETFPGSSILIITGTRNGQAAGVAKLIDFEHRVKADNGATKTNLGLKTFLAIRSYISTIRKNGLRAATERHNALLGAPWMPQSPRDLNSLARFVEDVDNRE